MHVQASAIVISLEVRIERLRSKFGWGCLCSFYANTVWKAWIHFSLHSVQSQVILIFVKAGVMIISLETGNERPSSNFSWGLLCSSYVILWKKTWNPSPCNLSNRQSSLSMQSKLFTRHNILRNHCIKSHSIVTHYQAENPMGAFFSMICLTAEWHLEHATNSWKWQYVSYRPRVIFACSLQVN